MSEIFLLRHGETEWNALGRFQGQRDSPLTAPGREQAARMGRILHKALDNRAVPALHVSPLGRARETATIVCRYVPGLVSMKIEPRLQEVTTGAWDGMTREEIEAGWPHALADTTCHDWYFQSPDGERFEAAFERAREWVRSLTGPVVAVSHGLLGRLLRGAWLGLSAGEMLCLPVPQDVVWHLSRGKVSALVEV